MVRHGRFNVILGPITQTEGRSAIPLEELIGVAQQRIQRRMVMSTASMVDAEENGQTKQLAVNMAPAAAHTDRFRCRGARQPSM